VALQSTILLLVASQGGNVGFYVRSRNKISIHSVSFHNLDWRRRGTLDELNAIVNDQAPGGFSSVAMGSAKETLLVFSFFCSLIFQTWVDL
jgi:hypothetical protein